MKVLMMRRFFRDRAEVAASQDVQAVVDGLRSAAGLSKRLESRGAGQGLGKHKRGSRKGEIYPNEYIEPTDPNSRKRGKRRPKLSLSEKIGVVHRVIINNHMVKDVAKEFRISQCYVSQLVQKTRRNPKFL